MFDAEWRAARHLAPCYLPFVTNSRRVASALATVALLAGCPGATTAIPDGGDSGSADAGAFDSGVADAGTDAGTDAGAWTAAAHPPLPVLTNRNNGPVLTAPKVYLVFYPGYPYQAQLQTFAQKMAQSTYWSATTGEYGIGPLAYAGAIELTGQTAPALISSVDVGAFVATQIQNGAFGAPDPQAIYTLFYPTTTVITQPNPVSAFFGTVSSCVAFGGYHNNVGVDGGDGGAATDFAYAVIPLCSTSADASTVVDSLTEVLSHEWVEAATDPVLTTNGVFTLNGGPKSAFFTVDDDHFVWGLLGGGEAADLCEFGGPLIDLTPADLGHLVQRSWSNASAALGHDPCVPTIPGPFFDSAPVLTETVTLSSALIGTFVSKGITIPLHQSKVIDVALFSDGPTTGPWTVKAEDLMEKQYGLANTLAFQWDQTTGRNGDVLHLTITVNAASPIAGGHAFLITSTQGQRTALWPGLIVE